MASPEQTGELAHNRAYSRTLTNWTKGLRLHSAIALQGIYLKKIGNALLISSASTGILFAYYLLSGQAAEIAGLWVHAIAMFVGVFGYLLFAARKPRSKHRK